MWEERSGGYRGLVGPNYRTSPKISFEKSSNSPVKLMLAIESNDQEQKSSEIAENCLEKFMKSH